MNEIQALNEPLNIEIGEETYRLRYNWKSICLLKKLTKKNLLVEGFDATEPEHLLLTIYCGLLAEHPELKGDFNNRGEPAQATRKILDKLEDGLEPRKMVEYMKLIQAACKQTMPASELMPGKSEAE